MKLLTTSASTRKLYAILGIPSDANLEQIRASFLSISKSYHPDVLGYSHPLYEEARHAYGVLTDPVTRRIYDLSTDDTLDTSKIKANALGVLRAFTGYLIKSGRVTGNLKSEILKLAQVERAQLVELDRRRLVLDTAKILVESAQYNWIESPADQFRYHRGAGVDNLMASLLANVIITQDWGQHDQDKD